MKYISFLFCILLLACNANLSKSKTQKQAVVFNSAAAESEIKETMQDQEDAWNAGDLEGFMDGYWRNPALSFIGSRGITYGWETTLANYKKGYPTPEKMGKLTFTIDILRNISPQCYAMVGQYRLDELEGTPTGYFSLVWELKDGRWLITADHSC